MEMVEIEMREDIKNNITKKERNEYRVRVIDRPKAMLFIKSTNRKRYSKLLLGIREQHSFKNDVYPRILADAYKMLSSHTSYNKTVTRVKRTINKTTITMILRH